MGSNVMMNMNMLANGTKQTNHSTEDFAAVATNGGTSQKPHAMATKTFKTDTWKNSRP